MLALVLTVEDYNRSTSSM